MRYVRSLFFVFCMAVVAGILLPGVFTSDAAAEIIPCILSDCVGDCLTYPEEVTAIPCLCINEYGCSGRTPYPVFTSNTKCDGTWCWQKIGCSATCVEE